MQNLADQTVDVKVFLDQALRFAHERSVMSVGTSDFAFFQKVFWAMHDTYAKIRVSPDPMMTLQMGVYSLLAQRQESGIRNQEFENAPVGAPGSAPDQPQADSSSTGSKEKGKEKMEKVIDEEKPEVQNPKPETQT